MSENHAGNDSAVRENLSLDLQRSHKKYWSIPTAW